MKKILTASVLAGLLIVPMAAQAVSNKIERGYISVSGAANTEVAPDVAEISFAVQTSDTKSMQKATLMNKEASDRVLSVLSSMLNKDNGDYIKTSDFSASPIYTYSGSKRNLDKYEVSNRVIVHTKSLDKIGAMIDKAIELLVVVSSFAVIKPRPYLRFAKLNARSTSILSLLSMYSCFLSTLLSFLGRPSAGPEIRIPCSEQNALFVRFRYI